MAGVAVHFLCLVRQKTMAPCSSLTAAAIPCLPAADETKAIHDCCLSCMALDDGLTQLDSAAQ